MHSRFVAILGLISLGTASAQSQAAGRPVAVALALGLNAPVRYYAPISPFDHTVGPTASLDLGVPPGRRWLAPRLGVSVHSARADASWINLARLELAAVLSPPRPLGSLAPYASVGVAAYTARFDRCGVPTLILIGPVAVCSGNRTGLGWQAALGAAYLAPKGVAPFAELRFAASREAFNTLALVIGAML